MSCSWRAPTPESPFCIRRATTITGCCARSCTGAVAARTAAMAAAMAAAISRRPDSMLTHLQLRDLVIVDEAELEFGPGLTALTGETGAGKSIVVDALLLIAGGRGAGDVVRHGAERAEVAADFAGLSAGRAALARGAGDRARRRSHRAPGDRRRRPLARLRQRPAGADSVAARIRRACLIEIHGQQEYPASGQAQRAARSAR